MIQAFYIVILGLHYFLTKGNMWSKLEIHVKNFFKLILKATAEERFNNKYMRS